MGAIYKAIDRELDRTVAVKCLLNAAEPTARDRALREAKTLATLNHPNIISVYDIVSHQDQVSVVTEWIEGKTLSELSVPMEPVAIAAIAIQLMQGLAAAHKHDIFHRDIKPANVMLSRDGRVILLDFGVAFAPGHSSGETIAGSLRYCSPSVLEGGVPNSHTDLYSALLVITELLIGYPVVPDMAPLPLYRFHKDRFSRVVRRALDGHYPPLAELLRHHLTVDNSSPFRDSSMIYQSIIDELRTILRGATNLSAQDYLSETAYGQATNRDAQLFIDKQVEEAIAGTDISPKLRAQWLTYADTRPKTYAETSIVSALPKQYAQLTWRYIADRPRLLLTLSIFLVLNGFALTFWQTGLLKFKGSEDSAKTQVAELSVNTSKSEVQVEAVKEAVKEALKEAVKEARTDQQTTQTADESAQDAKQKNPTTTARALTNVPRVVVPKVVNINGATVATEKEKTPDTAKKATSVSVFISANAWADLIIDGVNVGRLPTPKPFVIATGTHKIRLESPYVQTLETEVIIGTEKNQRLRFSLNAKSSIKVIRLAKPGQLVVDGVDHGSVTEKTIPLSFGAHEIWIKRGDSLIDKHSVAIGPESPEVLTLE